MSNGARPLCTDKQQRPAGIASRGEKWGKESAWQVMGLLSEASEYSACSLAAIVNIRLIAWQRLASKDAAISFAEQISSQLLFGETHAEDWLYIIC